MTPPLTPPPVQTTPTESVHWTLDTLGRTLGVLVTLYALLRWPLQGIRNAFVLAALAAEPEKHKALTDKLYASTLTERERQGRELAAVAAQVLSIKAALDGRFDSLAQSVDNLAGAMTNVVDRLTSHGEDLAHMRGQIDTWNGENRRLNPTARLPRSRGGQRASDPRDEE